MQRHWRTALEKRIANAADGAIGVHTVTGASDEYPFVSIRGTRGDVYNVSLSPTEVVCNCPDFGRRGSHGAPLCKHLVYVLQKFRHATVPEVIAVAVDLKHGVACSDALRVFAGRAGPSAGPGPAGPGCAHAVTVLPKECPTCVICLEDFEEPGGPSGPSGSSACMCAGCGNRFHSACIAAWLRCTRSCPLCKSAWCAAPARVLISALK
jgi:hypothetical protein